MISPDFTDAVVKGIPLFWLVMALVTFLGKMGVQGRWQLAAALAIGALIGVGYQATQAPLATFADWFGAFIYGLGLGCLAVGVYETQKKISQNGFDVRLAIEQDEGDPVK